MRCYLKIVDLHTYSVTLDLILLINEIIGDETFGSYRGYYTIQHSKFVEEARDLALVLRAGALPVQLDFLEQRTVGPSLGEDSIQKAKFASLIGSMIVFIFILFYFFFQ